MEHFMLQVHDAKYQIRQESWATDYIEENTRWAIITHSELEAALYFQKKEREIIGSYSFFERTEATLVAIQQMEWMGEWQALCYRVWCNRPVLCRHVLMCSSFWALFARCLGNLMGFVWFNPIWEVVYLKD